MPDMLSRREVLAAGLGAAIGHVENRKSKVGNAMDYSHLPRWRGFNLLEKFTLGENAPYRESDFDMLAELSFDFVRLPTDYRCWTTAPSKAR